MKYYVEKLLTNTAGEDGSSIAVYTDTETQSALTRAKIAYYNSAAAFLNADDVLYVVIRLLDENSNTIYKEIVDNRPAPEPEPTI